MGGTWHDFEWATCLGPELILVVLGWCLVIAVSLLRLPDLADASSSHAAPTFLWTSIACRICRNRNSHEISDWKDMSIHGWIDLSWIERLRALGSNGRRNGRYNSCEIDVSSSMSRVGGWYDRWHGGWCGSHGASFHEQLSSSLSVARLK